jgi:hypothetical protein
MNSSILKFIILNLLIFSSQFLLAQKIYIVNNQKDYVADFTELQTAVDSVPAGSIIYLQPSAIPYKGSILRKKILIYGNGYFLGQNQVLSIQQNIQTSNIEYLNFKPGSDASLISGVQFKRDGIYNSSIYFDTVSNIIIERSLFDARQVHLSFKNASNISIRQSFFQGPSALESNPFIFYNSGTSSATLSNNIILGGEIARYAGDYSGFLFDHNTFITQSSNFHLENIRFTNNIFYKKSINSADTTVALSSGNPAGSSSKNISNYPIFNSATNQIISKRSSLDSIIISSNNSQGITSDDGIYKIRASSIAVNYSSDGTDCGAFGGVTSYILSGLPPIPNIYYINVDRDATKQGGLKISLKVSAKN